MPDDALNLKIGAQIDDAKSGIDQVVDKINAMSDAVTGFAGKAAEFTKLGLAIEGARKGFEAIGEIKDWADSVSDAGAHVQNLSQQLGLSTEDVTRYGFAAQSVGLQQDQLAQGLERLERNMTDAQKGTGPAAAAFDALGLTVTTSTGQLKTLDQILPEIADKFQATKDGPEKTAIAIALFGRAGADLVPILDKGSAGLDELGAAAERTGSVLSAGAAKAADETSGKFTALNAAFNAVSRTLFEVVEPAINAVVDWLTRMLEAIERIGRTWLAANAPALLSTQQLAAALADVNAQLAKEQETLAFNAGTGARQQTARADTERRINELIKERNALLAEQAARQTQAGEAAAKPTLPSIGTIEASQTGAPSQLQQWHDELDQQLITEQNFFKDSKAEELAFWQAKLQLTDDGSKEQLEVRRQIYSLEKSMALEGQATQLGIAKAEMEGTVALAKERIEGEKQNLDAEVTAGQITARQKLQVLQDLNDEEYRLDLEAAQHDLDTAQQGTAAWTTAYYKLQELMQQHETEMAANAEQIAAAQQEAANKSAEAWKANLIDPVQRAMDGMLQGILQGTQTWEQAMGRAFGNMALSFIEDVAKMLVQWAAFEAATSSGAGGLAKAIGNPFSGGGLGGAIGGLFGGGGGEGQASQASDQLNDSILGLTTSVDSNTGSTDQSTGGLLQSIGQDAINVVQWIANTGATTANTIALFASKAIPSFDVGSWGVPSDMIAQIHQGEIIVPAGDAAQIRAGGAVLGSGGGQAGGGSGGVTVVFQVSALDGPSVQSFFNKNAAQLANTVARFMGNNPSARGAY